MNARKLQLHDPRVFRRYIHELKLEMKKHKLDNIIRRVYEAARDHPTDRSYDHLLNITVSETVIAMFTAESNYRKYKTGANDWTPIYKEAAAEVAFWRMVVRRASGKRINTRTLFTQQQMLPTILQRDLATTSTNKATKIHRLALTHRRRTINTPQNTGSPDLNN